MLKLLNTLAAYVSANSANNALGAKAASKTSVWDDGHTGEDLENFRLHVDLGATAFVAGRLRPHIVQDVPQRQGRTQGPDSRRLSG